MTQQTAGRTHINPPVHVTGDPPTRSKVTAGLAALACAACCALPFLIAAGVLTGAGAALAQNVLLAVAGLLVAAAGLMWWLHHRRTARNAAAAGASGCADGSCSC
jgi:mercuric ion transport protein